MKKSKRTKISVRTHSFLGHHTHKKKCNKAKNSIKRYDLNPTSTFEQKLDF